MSAGPVTSIDLPEDGSVHCWCCGTIDAPDRMVNLGDHPEVHLCLGCAHSCTTGRGRLRERGSKARQRSSVTGSATCAPW